VDQGVVRQAPAVLREPRHRRVRRVKYNKCRCPSPGRRSSLRPSVAMYAVLIRASSTTSAAPRTSLRRQFVRCLTGSTPRGRRGRRSSGLLCAIGQLFFFDDGGDRLGGSRTLRQHVRDASPAQSIDLEPVGAARAMSVAGGELPPGGQNPAASPAWTRARYGVRSRRGNGWSCVVTVTRRPGPQRHVPGDRQVPLSPDAVDSADEGGIGRGSVQPLIAARQCGRYCCRWMLRERRDVGRAACGGAM
jgi:hypothetical protein